MKIDNISDYELAAKKYKLLDLCKAFPNSDIMIEISKGIQELVDIIEKYKGKEPL